MDQSQQPHRGPLCPPLRQPSEKPSRDAPRPRVAEPWLRAATRSGRAARKRWGPLDRAAAERMARTYRAALLPRRTPGSKPIQETVDAARMYQEGMETYFADSSRPRLRPYQRDLWQRIYRAVFPDYAHLDYLDRQYRAGKLRRNVARLLRRRGIRFPLAIRTRAKREQAMV